MTDGDRDLLEQAQAVAAHAYAPYSGFHVGAAVRTGDGRVFLGVNVENAAYPLGICAEKSALVAAVSAGCGPGDFRAIAVTASPCGGCRQWLHELRVERVLYLRGDGSVAEAAPADLLPDTFAL